MQTKKMENAKLGLFVLAGVLFLIFSLYMIGSNRNLFGSTFTIEATFHNVNGLTPGNNVRFSGIDVGTVHRVELESDSVVLVTMLIDKDARTYIKKNALAAVGTDGLMGNKLININAMPGNAAVVEEGDRLSSVKPVETDAMLRTLNITNNNMAGIATDLKKITQKINSSTSLWKLISDSTLALDLRQAAANFNKAGSNVAVAGKGVADLINDARYGNGLTGTLISDTSISHELRRSVGNMKRASARADTITKMLAVVVRHLNQGEGAAGAIIGDSVMLQKLNQTFDHVEQGTGKFNENMEAMRDHFLFKGYFKKMEKEQRKAQEEAQQN